MKFVCVLPVVSRRALRAAAKARNRQAFDCYVQAAEARMDARKSFPACRCRFRVDRTDRPRPEGPDHRGERRRIRTNCPAVSSTTGSAPFSFPAPPWTNWSACCRIMIIAPQYFPETISSSKLLCLTGTDRFHYSMRMKEPAVLDVDSDVVWERVDAQRWRCRSSPRSRGSGQGSWLSAAPEFLLAIRRDARRAFTWRRRPSR